MSLSTMPSEELFASLTVSPVNETIQATRDHLRDLDSDRNASHPISRIPTEVLARIFETMALAQVKFEIAPEDFPFYLDCENPEVRCQPYSSWLPVTQVCRTWRTLALNTPRVWSCIYNSITPRLAVLFLERAKSAPLCLRSTSAKANINTIMLVLSRHSQLKEVDVRCKVLGWEKLFAGHLPFLDTLTLNAPIFSVNVPPSDAFLHALPPDTAAIPALRHLNLRNCSINLELPHFSCLRTLKLTHLQDMWKLPMDTVIRGLRNMPDLEVLEMANVFYPWSATSTSVAPVDLPRLVKMHFTVEDPLALLIMTYLRCPSIQSVDAVASGPASSGDLIFLANMFYQYVSGISPSWKTTLQHTFLPMSAVPSNPWAFRILLTSSLVMKPDFLNSLYDHGRCMLSVGALPSDTSSIKILSTIVPPESMKHSTFILSGGFSDIDEDLMNFLRSMVDIEEFRIASFSGLVTILADTPTAGMVANPSGTSFALPSLKRIVEVGTSPEVDGKSEKMKELERSLEARKAMGAAIETLTMGSPFLDVEEIQVFKPVVEKVLYAPFVQQCVDFFVFHSLGEPI
ncbi:hypothetical protein ONZ45_g9976 [Pleurotus djamor]|nr:hypothetical protein ONZ45_g9976 [Pleurotus djamor]